jgi:hypothetical protein
MLIKGKASPEIIGIVGEGSPADSARFLFPPDTDEKWMQLGCLRRLEHGHRTRARRDHFAVGEADPLTLVLSKELVADGPVLRLVLAPIGMDLPGNFKRQLIGDGLHRTPSDEESDSNSTADRRALLVTALSAGEALLVVGQFPSTTGARAFFPGGNAA